MFFLFTVGMEIDAVSDSGSEGESLVCVEVWGRERFDNLPQYDVINSYKLILLLYILLHLSIFYMFLLSHGLEQT